MKIKYLPIAMVALMLAGCANTGEKLPSEGVVKIPVTEAPTEATLPKSTASQEIVMPVLNITTVSTDKNVTDFINKPINGYVSASIASWTPGYKRPPEPYYEDCLVSMNDASGSNLFSDAPAQVKVRGNWTTSYDKKPLRIKFAKKQAMDDLNGGAEQKNWVLLAEYKDGSMLRNKTAMKLSEGILGADGYYSADCELVEVYVNGEYRGVYLLTEQQQVSPARINITEPEKDYTGTDIGYFIEFDGYFTQEDELHGFHVDYNDNAPIKPYDGNDGSNRSIYCLPRSKNDKVIDVGFTIKSEINSQEQHDFIADFVDAAYEIMYAAAYDHKALVYDSETHMLTENPDITPQEAVELVVDTQSLADTYIISELACDADIYWSSFYMSADFGAEGNGKLTFEAPWDFDSAFGNKDRCADGTGFYACNIVPDVNGGPKKGGYETVNPWLAVLMYEDWFTDIIRDKWTNAYDSGLFSDTYAMIDADAKNLAPAFDRNYERWNNLVDNSAFRGELCKKAAACRTHSDAAKYLREWLESRVEFMNEQWHN